MIENYVLVDETFGSLFYEGWKYPEVEGVLVLN